MKKASIIKNFLTKIIFFSLFVILPFIAGCDAVSEDAYVFTKNLDYVYINLDLAEASMSYTRDFLSRTITAPDIDLESSAYHYYVWGKSTKSTVEPKEVEFTSDSATSGTIPLDFPISNYYFTLAVTVEVPDDLTDSSEILKKAVAIFTQK